MEKVQFCNQKLKSKLEEVKSAYKVAADSAMLDQISSIKKQLAETKQSLNQAENVLNQIDKTAKTFRESE